MDKKYSIHIYWSDIYGHYISSVPEFGILADGETREGAIQEAEIVLKMYIEDMKEDGEKLPDPIIWEKKDE